MSVLRLTLDSLCLGGGSDRLGDDGSERGRGRPESNAIDFKINIEHDLLMSKSTAMFDDILRALNDAARVAGLNDAEWSRRGELRKETLSRLRSRSTCDFETLRALADVLGMRIGVLGAHALPTDQSHFPAEVDREYEERLADLCKSRDFTAAHWARLGPAFFMAGLAVMLASVDGYDRRRLLALSEELHPGASEPQVFARWLDQSPIRPSRFIPLLAVQDKHAA